MTAPIETCPACGFKVFDEGPGSFEICPVCGWEHDGLQYADPNYRGGANGCSLADAQARAVREHLYEAISVGDYQRDPWWRPLIVEELSAGRAALSPYSDAGVFTPYWRRSPLGWDTVLTSDWYDGPREGVAAVDGRPHAYTSTFADVDDEIDVLELRPIDDVMERLVIEEWQIWLRWLAAKARGEDVTASHPAVPMERARLEELRAELKSRRERLPAPILARPEWGWPPKPSTGARAGFAVRWEILR